VSDGASLHKLFALNLKRIIIIVNYILRIVFLMKMRRNSPISTHKISSLFMHSEMGKNFALYIVKFDILMTKCK
jgi:hypothetical protein